MPVDNKKELLKNDANAKEIRKNVEMDEKLSENVKRRIESMSDEEIIQENLKELLEKKSREERKANGRLVAVILVLLVIFLAVYHVWIRKTTGLAGVLVPAVIMLSYGGWVVILAKRDKQKQALFEKHLEEIVQKNKTELVEKSKLIKQQQKQQKKLIDAAATTATTSLYFENEMRNQANTKEHRKHRRHRNRRADSTTTNGSICSTSSSSSAASSHAGSSHHGRNSGGSGKILLAPPIKDGRIKRPSIRQKLFKQKAELNLADGMVRAVGAATTIAPGIPQAATKQSHKKRLQRLDAINKTPLARMSSVP